MPLLNHTNLTKHELIIRIKVKADGMYTAWKHGILLVHMPDTGSRPPEESNLHVSIVVTVRNEAKSLPLLLEALANQTHPPQEVVVTVALSSDDTLAVARSFSFPSGTAYQVIDVGAANRSEGRNLGVQASNPHNAIIAFTDAGCLPATAWLENLIAPFQNEKTLLVSGFTWGKAAGPTAAWQEAQLPFVLVPQNKIDHHPLPATRNMAIRRRIFLEQGGFRTDLTTAEDHEFARRLAKQGIRAVFQPGALVNWQPRPTVWSYAKMIWQLTVGDLQAGNWRPSHWSMWVRYLILLVWWCLQSQIIPGKLAALSTLSLYLAYLLYKVSQWRFKRMKSYGWAVLLQLVTDGAILIAVPVGFALHLNKTLHLRKQNKEL